MAWIDAETDNLTAALRYAPDLALRLAGLLDDYWWLRGDPAGLARIDAALEAAGPGAPARDRARAQLARANQFQLRTAVKPVLAAAQASLELYEELGDDAGMSDAYARLAGSCIGSEGIERSRELAECAYRHAELAGDEVRLGNAGIRLLYTVPAEERLAALAQVAGLLRRVGDHRGISVAYNNVGWLSLKADRPHEALDLLGVALGAAEAVGSPLNAMIIQGNLGWANLFTGDVEAARAAFVRQLSLCAGLAFPRGASEGLIGVAALSAEQGRFQAAARLEGAGRAMGWLDPDDREVAERFESEYINPARERYGAAAWHRANEDGAALSYGAAIAYGLEVAESVAAPHGVHAASPADPQAQRRAGRRLATVMFTDIVGSTELLARLGDHTRTERLTQHDAVITRTITENGGCVVAHTGDGTMCVFDEPAAAIRAARALRAQLAEFDLHVRAGIHSGECEFIDGNVRGMAVHIAARVGALAGADDVLVSRTVRDLVRGSTLTFTSRGEHDLRGVPGAWELFSLDSPSPASATPLIEKKP